MLASLIDLDRSADAALVRQLFTQIRRLVEVGRLEAGHRLPPSRVLAEQLAVGRNTVMLAYEQLALEGYLETGGRRGTRVSAASRGFSMEHPRDGEAEPLPAPRLSGQAQRVMAIGRRSLPAPSTFQPGLPETRQFPHDIWGRLLRRAARHMPVERSLAGYAHFTGLPKLRRAVLEYVARERGVVASEDQVVILSSAQAAMDLVCRMLLDPGDWAMHEEPGYAGMLASLRGVDARIRPLRVTEPQAYAALLAEGMELEGGEQAPRLVYATPSHQFPTGRVMSLEERLALLRYAAERDAFVLEDDYDSEFHFSGAPISCLQGLDRRDVVIYMGTFAKSLMPSIRVAYLVLPRRLVEAGQRMLRNIGAVPGAAVQGALADFLAEGHFRAYMREMNRIYETRRDCLLAALSSHCAGMLDPVCPDGGIQLPAYLSKEAMSQDRSDVRLVERLRAVGVESSPLSKLYWSGEGTVRAGLFLGYAASDEREIGEGVARIARVLAAMQA